jgi:cell division protein FtsB
MEFKEFGPVAEAEERYRQKIENIAKHKKSVKIISLALFCFMAFIIFGYIFVKSSNARINRIRLENNQLQLKYDSISNSNNIITIELNKYQNKIDSLIYVEKELSNKYEQNKQQIKKTKNKYEKNNRIDNFSSPDIIRYFTDSI